MPRHAAECFESDLREKVNYYRREFDLTYAECIGVLAFMQAEVTHEALHSDEEEEEDEK